MAAQLAAREFLLTFPSSKPHNTNIQRSVNVPHNHTSFSCQHCPKPHLRVELREQVVTCLEAVLGVAALLEADLLAQEVRPVVPLAVEAHQAEDLWEADLWEVDLEAVDPAAVDLEGAGRAVRCLPSELWSVLTRSPCLGLAARF